MNLRHGSTRDASAPRQHAMSPPSLASSRPRWLIWSLGLLCCISLLGVTPSREAIAQVQLNSATPFMADGRIDLFDPSKGATGGLRATVYPPALHSGGYLRWRVELRRADNGVFPNDQVVDVHLFDGNWRNDGQSSHFQVALQQGNRVAVAEPTLASWSGNGWGWNMRFELEGNSLVGLDSGYQSHVARNQTVDRTCLLIASKEPGDDLTSLIPNLDLIKQSLEGSPQWMASLNSSVGTNGIGEVSAGICWPEKLPTQWLELSSFGMISLSMETLRELREEQRQVLNDYCIGGGVLVLTRCDDDSSAEIAKYFSVQDPAGSKITNAYLGSQLAEATYYNCGMGKIAETHLDDLVINRTDYHVLENEVELRHSFQGLRGTSLNMVAGTNYWNWLIPNVGQPPIWTFVIFIGLFAGLAGPLLLWMTMRARRPSWLLFLFPSLAALVSCILLMYAVLNDGFTTVARARSVTYRDLGSQRGFLWARQTTFSGSPPRQGMRFPAGCEVSPMNWEDEYSSYQPSSNPIQHIQADSQSFTGFLKTREQQQVLLRMPIAGDSPISIETGSPPIVKNLSAQPWLMVAVCDENSNYWIAEAAAPQSTIALRTISPDSLIAELQKRSANFEPSMPPGLIQGQHMSILDWSSRGPSSRWNGQTPLMELQLRKWCSKPLPTRTYILFAQAADYVPSPIEKTTYSDSFHVMVGKW